MTRSNHVSVRCLQRQYEARGLVSKITSHSAVSGGVIVNEVQRDYSPFGLLVSDWQSLSGAVATSGGSVTPRVLYGYTAGTGNKLRRTTVTYPNTARVLNLEYGAANTIDDHLGRIASLDLTGTNIAASTYCGAAWQVEIYYQAANLELTFKQQTGDPTGDAGDIYTGYDRFGRAIDLRWRVASTNAHLERVQYGFDRADRRQWRRRVGVGTPFPVFPDLTAEGEGDRYYRYDALGQVLAEDFGDLNLAQSAVAGIPNAGARWSYDPTGNIASAQEVIAMTGTERMARTYDKGNRITVSGDGAEPILTDRAGRITRLRGSGLPDFQMKWDAWGRLVEVKDASNVVLGSYSYDGLHRRVKRTAAGVTWSVFFNDDWKPIEERRASHPTLAAIQYFWGARHRDDLIRRDRAPTAGGAINEIRYVLMDYFSPLAITSGATITERYAFGAFGRRSILNAAGTAVIASSTVAWEFGFHGQFRDSETGLYNYGYRHYAPALGRFLSKDPIMEAGGNNLYRMAGNSAVNQVDHLGLEEKKRDCSSNVSAGHGWYTPGSPIERDKPKFAGDRCTAVGCFSGDVNRRLPGAVKYEGERFHDPEVPDKWRDPSAERNPKRNWTPNPKQPGYLWADEGAYNALISAINAAKAAAEADCKDEASCCKSVTISVNCPPGGDSVDFQELTNKLKKKALCGQSWKLDCESAAWTPSGFPS